MKLSFVRNAKIVYLSNMKNLFLLFLFAGSFFSASLFATPLLSAAPDMEYIHLPSQGDSTLYKDSHRNVNERVMNLLSLMTTEEKFWQLFMVTAPYTNDFSKYQQGVYGLMRPLVQDKQVNEKSDRWEIFRKTAGDAADQCKEITRYFIRKTRLGIPPIFFDEGLHGLCREGATVFPQAIGLAATFDTGVMHRVARSVAKEARAFGVRQLLSPVLNISQDPRWGRTEETFGEDPYLCSEMGVACVQEIEKAGIVATPKHFVANAGEGGRDSYPVWGNERWLENYCFPPFKAAIEKGGAGSVMTAYNSLDGRPCSANEWLLRKKLKGEWNFNGIIISDAGATGGANLLHQTATGYNDAGIQALQAGQDVLLQTDYTHASLFFPAYQQEMIPEAIIDSAVVRVLRTKFKLGLFDPPDPAEENKLSEKELADHGRIALEAALKSIVLLKNDQHLLPIQNPPKRVAVIGKDALEGRTGGYSAPSGNKISILDGIIQRFPAPVEVRYAPGCERESRTTEIIPATFLTPEDTIQSVQGLTATYFNNITWSGLPVLTRIDPEINFKWTLYPPDTNVSIDWYSVKWSGKITGPVTGRLKIGLEGNEGYRLYLDDSLLINKPSKVSWTASMVNVQMEKGRKYEIRVEFYETTGTGTIRLVWDAGVKDSHDDEIRQAAALAKQSDVAIVAVGLEEGEGRDRASLDLPGYQEALIQAVAATGTPVVVILVGGSAVTMSHWLDKVSSILQVWYPGEMGGRAIAQVLAGDFNPAGRLPLTYPRSEGQLPCYYNHLPTGRTDDYRDMTGSPLFPFGYGLSYTTFKYSGDTLTNHLTGNQDEAFLHFNVKNTGVLAGDEVVQLYIRGAVSPWARPVKELKGFTRIHLEPGESKKITFRISRELLSIPGQEMKTVTPPGDYLLMVGSSSTDIRLKRILSVKETPDTSAYIWPNEPAVMENLKKWQGYKFGIIIHMGLYSQLGRVESWELCPEEWVERKGFNDYYTFANQYRNTIRVFNPAGFDPERWAAAIKGAGARYVIMTTKHHDGFCLFDTQLTNFKVTDPACPFSKDPRRDIIQRSFDAFRKEGLAIGAYFSKPDWTHPDFWWPANPPKDRNPNYDITRYPEKWQRFVHYTQDQIAELTSGYGKLDILWLDGCWVLPQSSITPHIAEYCRYPHDLSIDMPSIVRRAREKQPGLLIVDRWVGGNYENYLTPEQKIPEKALDVPWESCITMGNAWGWIPGDQYKTTRELVQLLAKIVAKGGNLLLGIGPDGNGEFEPEIYSRLSEMGQWLKEYGEAIYETHPVEPCQSGKIAYTARNHATIYAIYLPDADETELPEKIILEVVPEGKLKMVLLGKNQPVSFHQANGRIEVFLSGQLRKEMTRQPAIIFKLTAE